MNAAKISEENAICREILRYGKVILYSDIFRQAAAETHHLHGSVADHTLNVCIISVRLCHFLERRQIRVCKKDLIQAALCHDLGMVGRSRKYRNRKDSWQSHAEESAAIARTLIPDLPASVEEIICTHMWPVAGPHPRSREGRVLGAADKYAISFRNEPEDLLLCSCSRKEKNAENVREADCKAEKEKIWLFVYEIGIRVRDRYSCTRWDNRVREAPRLMLFNYSEYQRETTLALSQDRRILFIYIDTFMG